MVGLADVRQAQEIIATTIRVTPMDLSKTLSKRFGYPVYLKLENLQKTGSFKIRGALNKLGKLGTTDIKGVVAASAGNHAQGVAYAAKRLNVKATIIMPEGAPIAKVSATRDYGAEVIFYGETVDDALEKAKELQEEQGYLLIHTFDDPQLIAGHGTIGLEILAQVPEVRRVVVPIGGGGLISGIALAIKEMRPQVEIIGVQAAGAPSMVKSQALGRITTLSQVDTIADGIAIKRPGELNFQLVSTYVDQLITVTDEEIASAILFSLERNKLVLEGAGAASLAALLHNHLRPKEGPCVLVLSGGNIDVNRIARIIERGLVKHNRRIGLRIVLPDRPGGLAEMTRIIGERRGNILEIHHNRSAANLLFGSTEVIMSIETRDKEHGLRLIEALQTDGYQVWQLK